MFRYVIFGVVPLALFYQSVINFNLVFKWMLWNRMDPYKLDQCYTNALKL